MEHVLIVILVGRETINIYLYTFIQQIFTEYFKYSGIRDNRLIIQK